VGEVSGTSGSYLYTVILEGGSAAELQKATDEWLTANIATRVVSMDMTAGPDRFYMLIVYKGDRRVRLS